MTTIAQRFEAALARPRSHHAYPLPSPVLREAPIDLFATGGEASLYVHVPYCTARCTYCFFVTQIGHGPADMVDYVAEIEAELDALGPALAPFRFRSLYYGGGTPGLLPAPLFSRLHERLAPLLAPDASVTVETHPHAADAERVRAWRAAGVDRVSLGVQTLDPALLRLVQRGQTERHILPSIDRLLTAGFDDVNLDLLYGLPEQTFEAWDASLTALIQTGVPSLSLYRTSFIPETRQAFARLGARAPRAEDARAQYALGFERLNAAGYEQPRFGASAFSRLKQPYGLNLHRRMLVSGAPMVGLGMGAYGVTGGYVYANQREREAYRADLTAGRLPVASCVALSPAEAPHKYVTEAWKQGFLCGDAYAARFAAPPETRFGAELAYLEAEKMIVRAGAEYHLTPTGLRNVEALASLFWSPAARDALAART